MNILKPNRNNNLLFENMFFKAENRKSSNNNVKRHIVRSRVSSVVFINDYFSLTTAYNLEFYYRKNRKFEAFFEYKRSENEYRKA